MGRTDKERPTTWVLLQSTLELGVPAAIADLQARCGPQETDFARIRAWSWVLAEHGDDLLFCGKRTAGMMAQMIEAVAVLAFCPGGIDLFDLHFEATAVEAHT